MPPDPAKELIRQLRAKQRRAEESSKKSRTYEARLKAQGRADGYRRAVEGLEDLLIEKGIL